jgi:hypothetical protein
MLKLQPLLEILDDIESSRRELGPPDENDPFDPWGGDPLVCNLSAAIVESGILEDGNPYSEGAERLWSHFPEKLLNESTQDLRDWIFHLTRAERFVAGSIWSAAQDGVLRRVVQELAGRTLEK